MLTCPVCNISKPTNNQQSEIARNVPENKITKTPDLNGKKFVGELVSLMKQVEQLKNERKNIEEKFKNTKIDAGINIRH